MRFLNLIQQDHTIRLTTYFLRQLSAFFIAYIAGRGTNQAAHGEFLHVLTHIDTDQ